MVSEMILYAQLNKNNVYSTTCFNFRNRETHPIYTHYNMGMIVEGYGGIIYYKSFFKDDFIEYYQTMCTEIDSRLSDDILISNYLEKYKIKKYIINTLKYNRKLIKVQNYGKRVDALHKGANKLTTGTSNRYINVINELKRKKLCYLEI